MMKCLLSVVFCVLFFSGCALRTSLIPTLTLAGPAINENNYSPSDYEKVENEVISEDFFHIIIIFPIKGKNQKHFMGMIDNAVQKICKEKGYSFLTNVRVYTSSFYIPYIYGQYKFIIKGEGWTKKQANQLSSALKEQGFCNSIETIKSN